jgi:hypothetical protein
MTYRNEIGGTVTAVDTGAANRTFTPAVAAGMPHSPGKLQPHETIAGADGGMVIEPRSASGTGQIVVDS